MGLSKCCIIPNHLGDVILTASEISNKSAFDPLFNSKSDEYAKWPVIVIKVCANNSPITVYVSVTQEHYLSFMNLMLAKVLGLNQIHRKRQGKVL